MKFGFIKIAAAVPTVKVGDCEFNLQQIESIIAQAEGKGVDRICFVSTFCWMQQKKV